MRRFNILFAFAAILLTSCVIDDVDFTGSYNPSSKGGIHIVGTVEDFDVKTVGTRADDDDIADSYISEMTMFIFKGNDNHDLIQGYTDATFTTECTSAINIQRGNPTFLIDTEEGILADLSGTSGTSMVYYNNNADDLGSCNIYIVANAWHQLSAGEVGSRPVDSIKTLSDLEAFVYQVDGTLAMPMIDESHPRGFPMIGKQQGDSFKLKKGDSNEDNAVATIPLKKLYSKVRFTMQINANQVVDKQIPTFKISKAEVFNVPTMARLGRKLDVNGKPVYGTTNVDDYVTEMGVTGTYTPSDYYHFTEKPFVIETFVGNKTTISHSTSATTDDIIEFSFYMPEHKVTPNAIQLPSSMTPDEREKYAQYYKPTGVGAVRNGDGTTTPAKIATFVRIHGSYTDHNGQILGVKYDIYLGQNNSDDFTIKRNQQLNNKLIITGLTNHKDAYPDAEGNISIDHRVEVEDKGFNLSMERTAILDAHFEVRPLDIELSPGSTMTITIPEGYRDWVGMESDVARYAEDGRYVSTGNRKAVRKYFTTNLVSELNGGSEKKYTGDNTTITANGSSIRIEYSSAAQGTKIFRIWFYIDENPNVYDKLWKNKEVSYAGITGDSFKTTDGLTTSTADNAFTVSKTTYRNCPVAFTYVGTDNDNTDGAATVKKTATINFQQWNLWRVWSADRKRYYDIEHEEEYLNNYASDAQYGGTQNGMPWGLETLQISDVNTSIYAVQSGGSGLGGLIDALGSIFGAKTAEEFANATLKEKGIDPKYDFYLKRDIDNIAAEHQDKFVYYNYHGLEFMKNLATIVKSKYSSQQSESSNKDAYDYQLDKLNLTQAPQSAIAYCYNKNKRKDDGTIDVNSIQWYLPAIDEIEEIAKGAYDEFDRVFQNNLYWSSQPAFTKNELNVSRIGTYVNYGSLKATFYEDDVNRARATFVYTTDGGTSWYPCSSEAPAVTKTISGEIGYVKITGTIDFSDLKTTSKTITDFTSTPGNKSRGEKCRIRAVYRSGTK